MSVTTTHRPVSGAGGSGDNSSSALASLLLLLVLIPIIPMALASASGQRAAMTFGISLLLIGLVVQRPIVGVPLSLVFVATLGILRRSLIPSLGWTGADPLLLVEAFVVMLFAANLLVRKQIPFNTMLSRMVLALLGIMVLQIVNPLQGGLMVGLGGALFYIIPLLWYYVGRKVGTQRIQEIVIFTALGCAFLGSLYGLKQHWFGVADFEMMWLNYTLANVENSQHTFFLGDKPRAFSFFISVGEYSFVTIIGICLCWCRVVVQKDWRFLIPMPPLALALFLTGSRGPVITAFAVCALIWAVQGRQPRVWIPRVVVALILAGFGWYVTLTSVSSQTGGGVTAEGRESTNTNLAVERQLAILGPANDKIVGSHSSLFLGGILGGIRMPIGRGLGSTTLASSKFGSGDGTSSEVDISNMWLSLGIVGGLLYTYMVFYILRSVLFLWQRQRTLNALSILVILIVVFGQWLNGGMYMPAMLCWFCIGALDRSLLEEQIMNRNARRIAEEAAGKMTALRGM